MCRLSPFPAPEHHRHPRPSALYRAYQHGLETREPFADRQPSNPAFSLAHLFLQAPTFGLA
ncbi:hypothetical protein DB31_6420 [Hyalangium minutum]|uniref:Uncharacterized protein n=1 Tax=Hyalangium minutum TaxID=394096 RepID=A0A085WP32_9BACT|nr:hypothetical protein DB31_6420 [Hyalangium minutum]